MPRMQKNMIAAAMVSLVVAAGVVWASNNINSVKRIIG